MRRLICVQKNRAGNRFAAILRGGKTMAGALAMTSTIGFAVSLSRCQPVRESAPESGSAGSFACRGDNMDTGVAEAHRTTLLQRRRDFLKA